MQASPRYQRRAFLEFVDVDQPEGDRVVQSAQCAVAVRIGDAHRGVVIDPCHGAFNGTAAGQCDRTVTAAMAASFEDEP